LAAIKAALDTALVREQQKFNKSLVFLTMSVSGGPFLGLLGTVLGVMITFAAIAETGDVNVAAIAPGVAAALAATVAGLAVAIPALFAYNFLSTRIRDLTIDMRVFSDELLAKIAERHS
jgi:biopolymer transport protein ExbB